MASVYPGALDVLVNPTGATPLTGPPDHASQHINSNDAIEAVQATLGINPQGAYATVAARLAATPAGANTQIQFNDGGVPGADIEFVFDKTNKRVGLGPVAPTSVLHIQRATGTADILLTSTDAAGFSELLISQATAGTGAFVDIWADGTGEVAINLVSDGADADISFQGGNLRIYQGLGGGGLIDIGGGGLNSQVDVRMRHGNNGAGFSFDINGTATGFPGTVLGTVGINKDVGTHDAFLHINNTAGGAVAVNKSLRIDNVGAEMLSVLKTGHVKLAELSTTPTDVAGFGHLFAKTADSKLYWRDDSGTEFDLTGGGGTARQESVTTENITGTDTTLTDVLNFTPVSNASVQLFLNGVFQVQGVGFDYTISGTTITWLAATGTAVDMTVSDVLVAVYTS